MNPEYDLHNTVYINLCLIIRCLLLFLDVHFEVLIKKKKYIIFHTNGVNGVNDLRLIVFVILIVFNIQNL